MIINVILIELLGSEKGFFLHSSAVCVQNSAYVFVGASGAGKSTISSLLSKKFPQLADDVCIIRNINHHYRFYQSSLFEKTNKIRRGPEMYIIKNIYFLKKGKLNSTKKITDKSYILRQLIKQLWTEEKYKIIQLKYLMDFVKSHNNFYYLTFSKERNKLIDYISKEGIKHTPASTTTRFA